MAENGTKALVVFDLKKITAGEMHAFNQALVKMDTPAAATIMAKFAMECPKDWGKHDDPQTYMNLPFFGEFQDVVEMMVEQGKNVRKK